MEKKKKKEDVCACGKNEVWWERKEKINKTKTILIIKEDMYCVGVCLVVSTYIIILTMMESCCVYRVMFDETKKNWKWENRIYQ